MKKSIIIGMGILIIMSMIAIAEIETATYSSLDETKQTFTKSTGIEYPNEDRILNGVMRLSIDLYCEDISNWNSNYPQYSVYNVSLRTAHTQKVQNGSQEYKELVIKDYGCDDSSTCDYSNTPISTGETVNWLSLIRCLLGLEECPSVTYTTRQIPFSLLDDEFLTVSMVTYFNGTQVIDDTPCRYGISYRSENCKGCSEMNYEQTVNSIETRQEQFVIKSNIYSVIDKAITLNYNLWTIVYYIVKIGAFLGAILGIFFIPFWVYYFIKKEFGK